jgi:hypothetical protein
MRRVRSFLPLAAPLTLMAGCGVQGESTGTLSQIVPASAYNDTPVPLQLLGGPFRPSVELDTYSGTAEVARAPFQVSLDPSPPVAGRRSIMAAEPTWKDRGEIGTTIPAGLPAGDYTIAMRDPRGNLVPPPIVFRSLGPDLDPPRVIFLQPPAGTAVSPGTMVTVVARLDDGQGHLLRAHWSVDSPTLAPLPGEDCVIGPGLLCSFTFAVPQGSGAVIDTMYIRVAAEDSVHNQSSGDLPIRVARPPVISGVAPLAGPTGGGTQIIVQGTGFVGDLSQILIDGVPIGGVVSGDAIGAVTKAHPPGVSHVTVSNVTVSNFTVSNFTVSNGVSGSNPLDFRFVAPPNLRLITPSHAPANPPPRLDVAGNDFSEATLFYWIDAGGIPQPFPLTAAADAPPPNEIYINSSRVQLNLPPGSGSIGILAHDDISGDSEIPDAFTFDPAP